MWNRMAERWVVLMVKEKERGTNTPRRELSSTHGWYIDRVGGHKRPNRVAKQGYGAEIAEVSLFRRDLAPGFKLALFDLGN
jgi:hypothetical protein